HEGTVRRTQKAIERRLPPEWDVRVQATVKTPDSRPEPDASAVRADEFDYTRRHPGPEDTAVAVEVTDSTLADDREVMGRIYARARVPVYWIINLPDSHIEVYTDPTGPEENPTYRSRRDYGRDDSVPLV